MKYKFPKSCNGFIYSTIDTIDIEENIIKTYKRLPYTDYIDNFFLFGIDTHNLCLKFDEQYNRFTSSRTRLKDTCLGDISKEGIFIDVSDIINQPFDVLKYLEINNDLYEIYKLNSKEWILLQINKIGVGGMPISFIHKSGLAILIGPYYIDVHKINIVVDHITH